MMRARSWPQHNISPGGGIGRRLGTTTVFSKGQAALKTRQKPASQAGFLFLRCKVTPAWDVGLNTVIQQPGDLDRCRLCQHSGLRTRAHPYAADVAAAYCTRYRLTRGWQVGFPETLGPHESQADIWRWPIVANEPSFLGFISPGC